MINICFTYFSFLFKCDYYKNLNYLCSMHVCILCRVQLFATPWTVCSLPGSSVYGIFFPRQEWVAISSSILSSTQGSNSHLLCLLHC